MKYLLYILVCVGLLVGCKEKPPDIRTANGKCVYYYENGQIAKTEYRERDTLNGAQIEYYMDGTPKRYICYDGFGSIVFYRSYDSVSGKIILDSGSIGPHGIFFDKELSGDNQIGYVCFFVQPPHFAVDVKNYLISETYFDTIKPARVFSEYDWVHNYYFKILHKDKYSFYQRISLRDSIRKLEYVYHDTVYLNLTK